MHDPIEVFGDMSVEFGGHRALLEAEAGEFHERVVAVEAFFEETEGAGVG